MNIITKHFQAVALTATLITASLTGMAYAGTPGSPTRLLTAKFESRQVAQVEVGDFHFKPGQTAPIHTHAAPAVGYVAKGEIVYQIEGQKAQTLREGDVFYEPAGPRILRFDNASATEEAIFLDFNLEQIGEPFIVFEKPPTEKIDRRTLPTIDLAEVRVDQVDIYASELRRGETMMLDNSGPTLGLVAEGNIELQVKGKASRRIVAGESFSISTIDSQPTKVSVSSDVPARVITFRLLQAQRLESMGSL